MYLRDFNRLAPTEEWVALGLRVDSIYQGFAALGDEIVALSQRRFDLLETFRQSVMPRPSQRSRATSLCQGRRSGFPSAMRRTASSG